MPRPAVHWSHRSERGQSPPEAVWLLPWWCTVALSHPLPSLNLASTLLPKIPMNRATVLRRLRAHKATMAQRFAVVDLALFGSFARDQATDASDVDLLVRFDGPKDWRRYFGAEAYLEDLLNRPVDLATRTELRAEIRPGVERDVVHV